MTAAIDWTRIRVVDDATHHHLDGRPLYAERFDAVLKFHAPGLAPVRRTYEAWHIDVYGRPAYARRFLATFGFYEGLAAVKAADGWHHIHPDGRDLAPARYDWCGNFQGGRCTVRDTDGRYHHIDAAGRPVYPARWRYAGDYRDGIAVVQRDDGLSTHIDEHGRPLHDRWLLDVDVFHKGFARARDKGGWMHVDRSGQPLYRRRFAAVEPFYNGQSRVENHDGSLEIIDETAQQLHQLRGPLRSEFHALSADIVGAWRTDTIAAAVELHVFDLLPATAAELAARTHLSHDGAARLLRALAELDLVEHSDCTQWRPTPRGCYLRCDHPHTLADSALESAGPLRARWSQLLPALRDAAWRPPDIFREVAADPLRRAAHHRMLRSYAAHDYAPLVARLPVPPGGAVLDAGGGTGALAHMLAEAWPGAALAVLDLPEVLADMPPHPRIAAVPGDLFAPWPTTADLVVLARVLHDWDDDAAVTILSHARAALRPRGKLVALELLLADDHPGGGLCDLHLRVVTGGRERSESQYRALFVRAGLRLAAIDPSGELTRILLAEPT